MLALWRYRSPVRTSQILGDVRDARNWSLSTLKVLLGRLADKGFVEVTRQGRFTLYRALVSEADYRRQETQGLLKRYYKNSVKSMIAALVEEESLSGEELRDVYKRQCWRCILCGIFPFGIIPPGPPVHW